ncbi:S-layer homology domain-containing protein [Domibacillus enclensis]|nr:S-layer homology domain-containing protein [Domibacillus enclensis]OXS79086.1 hypothetical protein B1B05_04725 [Domibacillus enclensis]
MKKWTPPAAAVLATSVLFSGVTFAGAAPSETSAVPFNVLAEQPEAKAFARIDSQLAKIEEKLAFYQAKLAKIEQEELDDDDDDLDDEDDSDDDNDDSDDDDNSDDDNDDSDDDDNSDDDNDDSDDDDSDDVDDDQIFRSADSDDDDDNDSDDDSDEDDDDSDDSDDDSDEDDDDDLDDDLDDEPGYRGKFNALQNRLNAVSLQLDKLEAKGGDAAAIDSRRARLTATSGQVTEALAALGQIEQEVRRDFEDDDVEEKAAKLGVSLAKDWTITFNKKLDEAALSTLDIVVLNAAGNLVETEFVYNDATKAISMQPLQPYTPGETYTLYVSKGVASTDGARLQSAVKMTFTVTASTTAAAAAPAFGDVPDRYKDAVDQLVGRGITSGVGGGRFGIDQQIKRVDAAVMLAKMLNLPLNAPDAGFKDVPQRAQSAVNALVKAGVVSGKTAVTFGSDQTLTRGELAIILTRALKLEGSGSTTFTDVPDRYKTAVQALVSNGITNGKSASAFGTADSIKRGDFAIFLHRSNSGSDSSSLKVLDIY